MLNKPPQLELTPLQAALIQKAYQDYAEIFIEKEFGGGYGGARVFLILPVKPNSASDARRVTKIGPAEALHRERDNYTEHVSRALPFSVAQVREYIEQDDQAALNYVFAGGETLGQTVSLEEYYHSHTAAEVVKTLTGLLDQALGSRWYRQSRPLNRSFRAEYGRHLPEKLETIVAAIWPGLPSIEGNQVKIPGLAGTFPDPLKVYPDVLDQLLEGRCSLVHGDLHPRNVLVDESGKSWLIDFAKVEERHNLFDFIKLETYLRLMVLKAEQGAFSWSEYAQFEQALNVGAMSRKATPPANTHLVKAYHVIWAIRKIAQNCLRDKRNFKKEYLPGLFLYCLATMKYYPSTGVAPAQRVYLTACVAAQYLSEEETMPLQKYFDLGLLPPEPTLGPVDKQARARRALQRFWLTLAMYLGVVLGILSENLLGLVKAGVPLTWSAFGEVRVLIAVIIAVAIFPQVFPKVFGRLPATESGSHLSGSRHLLQFCIAFQNGFFWQALLSKL